MPAPTLPPDGDAARVILRFLAALVVGGAGGTLFWSIGAPLPWVLGSMVACAAGAVAGLPILAGASTRRPMSAVLGVVLGSSFHPGLLDQARLWAVPLVALPFFLASAALLCILYFRRVAKLDRTTAYFCGMPGGIAEMVLMGAERGADERAIGLIHGARIFLVVFILPFLIRLVHDPVVAPPVPMGASVVGDWTLLLWGGGCILVGFAVGQVLRLPAWHLLGPLAVSAGLHMTGITDFHIPAWVIAVAQVGLGATIGCRFVGLTLPALGRLLLLSAGSTAILLVVTIAWAVAIWKLTGLDPAQLTLAYSPGGVAEMSMVALSLALEPGFVVIHHLVRVVLVIVAAPLCLPKASPAP